MFGKIYYNLCRQWIDKGGESIHHILGESKKHAKQYTG